MTTEIQMLMYSFILGIVQLFMSAGASHSQRGADWVTSPRDTPPAPLTGMAGRIDRAFQNYKETFPFFIAVVFLLISTNKTNAVSAVGAQLYFFARLIYVPLYLAGIPLLRTLVWLVSIVGILLMAGAWFW